MRFKAIAVCFLLALPLLAEKKVIQPKEFPTGRPFSPGILSDGTLYIAGQTGQDLKTGKIPDDFEAEVKQCLDNIGLVLKAARMNTVYTTVFTDPRPARTTVGVATLVGTARVEITVTARK